MNMHTDVTDMIVHTKPAQIANRDSKAEDVRLESNNHHAKFFLQNNTSISFGVT